MSRAAREAAAVAVIGVQVTEVAKDLTALTVRLDQHERDHAEARAERAAGRRWLIATLIAFAAVVEVPLLYLVAHAR
jgi:hypothetical protein